MKTLQRYLGLLIVAVMSSVALTGCYDDDDSPGGDWRLEGSWQLTGDEYGSLPQSAYCTFYFQGDGYGTYSCYDDYGTWQNYPMTWWADGSYLSISVSWDTWDYTYTVQPGWLYLYPQNGDPYLVFQSY